MKLGEEISLKIDGETKVYRLIKATYTHVCLMDVVTGETFPMLLYLLTVYDAMQKEEEK